MEIPFELTDKHRAILIALRDLETTDLRELDSVLQAAGTFARRYDAQRPREPNKFFTALQSLIQADSELIQVFRPREFLATIVNSLDYLRKDVEGLCFIGLIKNKDAYITFGTSGVADSDRLTLTAEGKNIAQRIAEKRHVTLRPPPKERRIVFIACAFGFREIDELCDICFMPAIEKLGYQPSRIDREEPPAGITDLMLQKIRGSVAVIADLTHARPSVYFEAGYAHAWGVPLVLTCHESHLKGTSDTTRIHFDLAQYKISFWHRDESGGFKWKTDDDSPNERLRKLLKEK